MTNPADTTGFGAVVIGRNEGERLLRCLDSLAAAATVVYVDSGSSDASVRDARGRGAEVVELDTATPFTAARARNAGFRRLREIAPDLAYVQFVDGDCELDHGWPASALSFAAGQEDIAAVCGRRREQHPEQSIYNWLCDQEWQGAAGEVGACGGDVMMRVAAVEAVAGYRDELIAGEEPEMCVRLRAAGWRIWRLDCEMTRHDAAMTRFGQWWRRSFRAGYAFAQGAHLHGASPDRFWVWESRRAWLFGIWLPLACLVCGVLFGPWGWAAWLVYPAYFLQKIVRGAGPSADRTRLALFYVLAMFPQGLGQLKFLRDRLASRQARIIEYK
jgi:glycosyltransferase involved in cell wall biosynthesis